MLNLRNQGIGPDFILRFISATNESQLERQMLKVQLRLKGSVKWRTPFIHPVTKKWYAYYEINFDMDQVSRELQKEMDGR